jgi:predicted  nucleic acid-binding Zn-ribbon protein
MSGETAPGSGYLTGCPTCGGPAYRYPDAVRGPRYEAVTDSEADAEIARLRGEPERLTAAAAGGARLTDAAIVKAGHVAANEYRRQVPTLDAESECEVCAVARAVAAAVYGPEPAVAAVAEEA